MQAAEMERLNQCVAAEQAALEQERAKVKELEFKMGADASLAEDAEKERSRQRRLEASADEAKGIKSERAAMEGEVAALKKALRFEKGKVEDAELAAKKWKLKWKRESAVSAELFASSSGASPVRRLLKDRCCEFLT